jgi:hypothetical protein
MQFILSIFLLVFSSLIFAQKEIITQVHDIDIGQKYEKPLVFLKSGEVVKLASKNILRRLQRKGERKSWFYFKIDKKNTVTSFKKVDNPSEASSDEMAFLYDESLSYFPSILKDMDSAKKYFIESRNDTLAESQCYNRAHIWAYEWRKKHQIFSSKAWLFFTRKFIRKYKFDWWFHVAPVIHVVHEGKVRERIMDMKYAGGPLQLKTWTDIFLRDNAVCPVINKYSDYADYPESGSCFVMKSSMYYYQPIDLEYLETEGQIKQRWNEAEVKYAYKDAFNVDF